MSQPSPFNVRTPEMVCFASIQDEYRDFIWNIATDEPLSGYTGVGDMPQLTDQDRSLVLRARPKVLEGITLDHAVLDQIYAAIVRQVFDDVQEECRRIAAQKEQIL